MSELEDKLGAILANPQIMQQIASMAQAMGQSSAQSPPEEKTQPAPSLPDPRMLQNIAGVLQKSNVDQNQQALLCALSPYSSQGRIGKLERAMRAARMAGFASAFLKSGGLNLFGGR